MHSTLSHVSNEEEVLQGVSTFFGGWPRVTWEWMGEYWGSCWDINCRICPNWFVKRCSGLCEMFGLCIHKGGNDSWGQCVKTIQVGLCRMLPDFDFMTTMSIVPFEPDKVCITEKENCFFCLVLPCLVLICFNLSYLDLTCLIYPVLSCLILSCLVLSYFVLSCYVSTTCLMLSCLNLSYFDLSYFVITCLILPYLSNLFCLTLSRLNLSYLALTCLIIPSSLTCLFYPVLSCAILSCFNLSDLVLFFHSSYLSCLIWPYLVLSHVIVWFIILSYNYYCVLSYDHRVFSLLLCYYLILSWLILSCLEGLYFSCPHLNCLM